MAGATWEDQAMSWRGCVRLLLASLAALLLAGLLPGLAAVASCPAYDTSTEVYDGISHGAGASSASASGRQLHLGPGAAADTAVYDFAMTVGVAAKGAAEVPTVVFGRSRVPGIAGTFDDAVANGVPTQLNLVGSAACDANRCAALRGRSPAPAGRSLDEYPFACSAQGGCGATVRSVGLLAGLLVVRFVGC